MSRAKELGETASDRELVREETALRRAKDRERNKKRRESMVIGHAVPGCHGHGSRMRKERAIAVTVVRRRCEACQQVYEAMVKDATCLYCGHSEVLV